MKTASILTLVVDIIMNILPMIARFFGELDDDERKSVIASLEKERSQLS